MQAYFARLVSLTAAQGIYARYVGEAKRRGGRPPTAVVRMWRWTNRLWLLYPKPIRSYVRLSIGLIAAAIVLFAGLLIVTGLVHVGTWLVHH
jgi:hypothetical protein